MENKHHIGAVISELQAMRMYQYPVERRRAVINVEDSLHAVMASQTCFEVIATVTLDSLIKLDLWCKLA
jgi:hypothetical protein